MENYIKSIGCYLNKIFYSLFFPIILIIPTYLIYKTEKQFILTITLYTIIIFCWLFKLIFVPKNRSKKYGIVFLINNGELYNENIRLMFKKIQFELQDNFKIFVFNNNFIRKLDKQEKIERAFFKKNYHMIIDLFSISAKENSENVCSLTNKRITFVTPVQKLDEETIENLQKDFCYGFKKILKLSEKNSYLDVNQNADLMSLSIRYFISIIYIIFNKINLAEEQLNLMDFSNADNQDKIVQYLRKSSVKRYSEIYYVRIRKKLNTYEYLYNESKLEELDKLTGKFNTFIDSDPSLTSLRYFMNDVKAKIYFAKGDYFNSYSSLIRMKNKNPNDYSLQLSYAFLEINQGNTKGFEIYKKVSKRKDIKKLVIEDCIQFINNALKNDLHNEGLLLLSKGILTYYWINSDEGKVIINNSLTKVRNQGIVDYVKIRFKIN